MTLAKTKSPFSLVTTGVDRVPRASLISVTVAPGTTPPCASLTVPSTVPVLTCASTDALATASHIITAMDTLSLRIMKPPILNFRLT